MVSRLQNSHVDLAKIKATYFEAERKGDVKGMRAAKQQAMAIKQQAMPENLGSKDTMQIPEDYISISQAAKDLFDKEKASASVSLNNPSL